MAVMVRVPGACVLDPCLRSGSAFVGWCGLVWVGVGWECLSVIVGVVHVARQYFHEEAPEVASHVRNHTR
jgi:hypothetical protein